MMDGRLPRNPAEKSAVSKLHMEVRRAFKAPWLSSWRLRDEALSNAGGLQVPLGTIARASDPQIGQTDCLRRIPEQESMKRPRRFTAGLSYLGAPENLPELHERCCEKDPRLDRRLHSGSAVRLKLGFGD